jgi:uncharacterized protein DUF397
MISRAAAPDAHRLAWFKSSYSAGNGGDCVEVARAPGNVHVRDSKRADGPVLRIAPAQWAAFVRSAAHGSAAHG